MGSMRPISFIFSLTSRTLSLTCDKAEEAKRSLTTRLCLKLPSGAISAPLSKNSLILYLALSGKRTNIRAPPKLSRTLQRANAPSPDATAKNAMEKTKQTPTLRDEMDVKSPAASAENAYAPSRNRLFSPLIPMAKPRHIEIISPHFFEPKRIAISINAAASILAGANPLILITQRLESRVEKEISRQVKSATGKALNFSLFILQFTPLKKK